jgi:hypothetical protein
VEVLPGVPQSFEAIDDVCRNGTLLCNLVPLIGGPVVKGVFWKPSSHKLAVSNVAKACRYGALRHSFPSPSVVGAPLLRFQVPPTVCFSALRGLKMFSPRFLDCAEEIGRGDREPLLGLLEDCHRYFDRQPPLPFQNPVSEPKSVRQSHMLYGFARLGVGCVIVIALRRKLFSREPRISANILHQQPCCSRLQGIALLVFLPTLSMTLLTCCRCHTHLKPSIDRRMIPKPHSPLQ